MIKKFKYKIYYILLPIVVKWILNILFRTIKLQVIGEEEINYIIGKGARVIYAFWHGHQSLLIPYMSPRKLVIMTSESRDGEYLTRMLKMFGYRIVRGSSTKGGVRGVINMLKELEAGHECGIAVDGPQGPLHVPKEGIIYLARKTGAYIVPLVMAVKDKWICSSAWDKYILPVPFTKGVIGFGKPYQPRQDTSISDECIILKQQLEALETDCTLMCSCSNE